MSVTPEPTRRRVFALKAQGYSIRSIARHLSITRNTVKAILANSPPPEESDSAPGAESPPPPEESQESAPAAESPPPEQSEDSAPAAESPPETKSPLLDPYKGEVKKLVTADEQRRKQNRRHKPLTTRRIFKEIRKSGYVGGRTILDDYMCCPRTFVRQTCTAIVCELTKLVAGRRR